MHRLAIFALTAGAALSCLAIAFLLRSALAAKFLIAASAIIGVLATLAAGGRIGESMMGFCAYLFAAASVGCAISAGLRLISRSTRWLHRFVIYAGYAAVFDAMSVVAFCLSARSLSGKLATALFVGIYVAGSLLIALTKALIVRVAARKMPDYFTPENLSGAHNDQPYW